MTPRIAILFLLATTAWAQRITDRRTAEIRGGGGEGKCTIEVVVDGAAEVEINGRNAVIRTLNGSASSIRRFQCNQEMPNRPNNFRFEGIDGRGRQDLLRAPVNGRPAVVRIEDRQGGSEGYTFDLLWNGGGFGGGGGGGFPGGGGGRGDDVRVDTAGRGNFNGDRQSERITRGWIDTIGQTVALTGDRDFRITFQVQITRSNRGDDYSFRIIDSDRGNAAGNGTFRLNRDHNEVELINVSGRLNGRNFNGNFRR